MDVQTSGSSRFWTRLAICLGSLVFGFGIYRYLSNESGSLNLVCRHNFQTADLSVSVDGRVAFSDQIAGSVKKRFGILDKKVEGTFSRTLAVPEGEHVVSVHLQSAAEWFDQTRQISINSVSGKEATVTITAQKGDLSLAYRGTPVTAVKDTSPGYFSSLRSVLFTVMGSVVSAAIGFAVQEFLNSRKAALIAGRNSKSTA